jgi:hypothetical protein
MTRRNLRFSILGVLLVALVGSAVWYSQLTPYQRCWTDKCREREAIAEFDAIEAAYARRIEATDRQIDEANRRVEQSQERIKEIDRAIATLECQKKGVVC